MLIPYHVHKDRENRLWEEILFLVIYIYFILKFWWNDHNPWRQEDETMRRFTFGPQDEDGDERETRAEKLRELHPEVADEEEDAPRQEHDEPEDFDDVNLDD